MIVVGRDNPLVDSIDDVVQVGVAIQSVLDFDLVGGETGGISRVGGVREPQAIA
jgi:hypothetical protein